MTDNIKREITNYGFKFGSAEFQRCFCDEKKGWTTTQLITPKYTLQIYVTKTGKVRIFTEGGLEWEEKKENERTRNTMAVCICTRKI